MNYAELAVVQASRAKTFSTAQTDAMTAYCQAEHDLKELQAENAKLRELVAELVSTTVKCQNGECDNCQFGNPTGFGCTWDARMRELGVEVDA